MAWSWVRVRVQELGELCSEPQRATAGTAGTQRPAWVEGMTLSAACKSLQNFFQPRTFTALSLALSQLARYSRSPTDTDVGSRTVPLHFTKSSLERLLRFDLPLPATSGHRPRTYITPPNIMPRGTSTNQNRVATKKSLHAALSLRLRGGACRVLPSDRWHHL